MPSGSLRRFVWTRPPPACGATAVALPPKAFDVLHYLVTHADRVVTKDELLDAVWPDTAVSDAVVRVAIGALRKALGDTASPARYIATVPRRGYRFVAPVTVVAPSTPGPTEALLFPAAPAPPPHAGDGDVPDVWAGRAPAGDVVPRVWAAAGSRGTCATCRAIAR